MNRRTAKLLRRSTIDRRDYQRAKKIWNGLSRLLRHAARKHMQADIAVDEELAK